MVVKRSTNKLVRTEFVEMFLIAQVMLIARLEPIA
jgi:hypothetical protein